MASSKIPPWLRPVRPGPDWRAYELELLPGLEPTAAEELRERFGGAVRVGRSARPGRLPLLLRGDPAPLLELRSAVAVHAVERFDIASPARLLVRANFTRLLAAVRAVIDRRAGAFETLRLSAAGADSLAFTRLVDQLLEATRLRRVRAGGDLLLAVRRGEDDGWEALVRLSARPLSARAWRVCNLPGALDATAAHAMVRLAAPAAGPERFLNLAAGSGTLLVERLALGPAARAVGVERDPAALACARANLDAAGASAALVRADLAALPFPDRSFDSAVADLPYGMLIGSPEANRALYARTLAEAARVLAPGGAFVIVTASWRLLERLLRGQAAWGTEGTIRLSIPFARGYLKPTIYLLRRR
ncbi:MAG TPA: methyltransferase domain-containing protein [Chloroflexota bacterium]|jgi:SAM-dependent methyltransferase